MVPVDREEELTMNEPTNRGDSSSGVVGRLGALTWPLLLVAALVALGSISLLALGGREAGAQTVGPEKAGGVTGWGAHQNVGLTSGTGGFSGAVAIAGGGRHSMVLQDDGRVVSWGDDFYGLPNTPTEAQSGVKAIAGGYSHSLALKDDGRVVTWGLSENGLGNIPTEAQSGVKAIAAGFFHSLALTNDGKVIAWGYNSGIGGTGGGGGQTNVPSTAQSGVGAIAAGETHSLALKNGGVIAWGDNYFGQTNVPVAAQSGVKAIAAGYDHSIALKNDGSVVAWGRNDGERVRSDGQIERTGPRTVDCPRDRTERGQGYSWRRLSQHGSQGRTARS